MSFLLGLTGSIGMGKSTTADMFRAEGIPVWDADGAVHDLYSEDGEVIAAIGALVADAVNAAGVDRAKLSDALKVEPKLIVEIEGIVHPKVAQHRADFIAAHEAADLIVLDIPLIFEKDMGADFDAVLVVTIDEDTQRQRVMAREGMTTAKFEMIRNMQVPDDIKRAKADYVIETKSLSQTQADVQKLIQDIRAA
ncbi:MAG: dephospho-CoA kinase [Pseudomonadota bacterium]